MMMNKMNKKNVYLWVKYKLCKKRKNLIVMKSLKYKSKG